MPRVKVIQQRYTQGELDPKMLARGDIDQFYGASETMRNVFPIPQGGFRRRPGLQYLDLIAPQVARETTPTITASNGGTTANANDNDNTTYLTTTTNISTTNPYVVVHYDLGSSKRVFFVDVVGLTITAGTSSQFYIQVSTDNSSWTTVGSALSVSTTALRYRTRVDGMYRYIRLARIGSTDLGTAKASLSEFSVWTTAGDVSNCKIVDFEFSTTQQYCMVLTDNNLAVYRDNVRQADIRFTVYESDDIPGVSFIQSADTLLLFHEDIAPRVVTRESDEFWDVQYAPFYPVPKYDFEPATSSPAVTLTPSAVSGTINLTAGGATFNSNHVDQYIQGNGGLARIVAYTSTTVVKAIVEIPFYDTTAIASGDWDLLTGYEDAWSDTRGWPSVGTFYEGRLFVGGTPGRPSTFWGSRVNDPFNYDKGTLLDDESFEVTLDDGQYNKITSIFGGKNLTVFTTGGEFVVLQALQEPITPTNINAKKQTSIGSKENLRVFQSERGIYYVQREGSSIQEFTLDPTQSGEVYANNIVSLLSGHLIVAPVDVSLRRGTSISDGNYLMIVNSDGTLALANLVASQEIASFVLLTTTGDFIACGVVGTNMYLAVEREIDGDTVRYLETFDDDYLLDCAIKVTSGLPTDTFTDLDYLEGETIQVIADGSVMDDEIVTGGSITISRDVEEELEVGFDFTPVVKDLPVFVNSPQLGSTLGNKKNVSEVTLQLYNTQHIVVQGKEVGFTGFGQSENGSPLDAAVGQFTGIKRMQGFRGWDFTGQVTITQTRPGTMTVLALSKKVNI